MPSFTISTGWCLTALSLTLAIRSPTSVTAIWLATRTSAARPTSSAKYGRCGFDQAVQAYFQVTDRHRALPLFCIILSCSTLPYGARSSPGEIPMQWQPAHHASSSCRVFERVSESAVRATQVCGSTILCEGMTYRKVPNIGTRSDIADPRAHSAR